MFDHFFTFDPYRAHAGIKCPPYGMLPGVHRVHLDKLRFYISRMLSVVSRIQGFAPWVNWDLLVVKSIYNHLYSSKTMDNIAPWKFFIKNNMTHDIPRHKY